jgi:multiple sugar transport system permease protein
MAAGGQTGAARAAPLGKKRIGRLGLRDAIDGYLFISPWILGFILFTAFPMGFSLLLTFMDYDVLTPPVWTGFDNYTRLISDNLVWTSLYNTAYYTFFSVPLRLLVALGAAMLLSASVYGLSFFRTAFYLPTVLPAVASAILWMWMYNPSMGLFNMGLNAIGLPRLEWLWNPDTSKPSLILMSLWTTGNVIIIFLAGLQAVPNHLYEAATVDGANGWSRFRHVTLPMLSPSILFNLIMGIIGSFQVFTSVFLMTGNVGQGVPPGGPLNSTLMTVLYVYRAAFEQFKMGYGSAIAWLLFLVILGFTIIQWKLSNNWVYYEGEER